MSKIKSDIEVAKKAVQPILDLEVPEFKKIEIKYSNIEGVLKGTEVNNQLGELMKALVESNKKFAKQIVAIAEKKEQDDKNDSAMFTENLSSGSGGGRSFSKSLSKGKESKKTDWNKFGREKLEDAGVYFKPDGSGYVVDPAQVTENIVDNAIGGAFDIYKEGKENQKKANEAYGHLFEHQQENSGGLPNKPDFDPNPNK